MSGTVLMVGTRKGLWIGTSDEAREEWEFTGPHHNMEEVYSCMVDTRSDPVRLFAGASSSWLGPQVKWSDDLGETWQETPGGAIKFPDGADASVERVWQLVPGIEDGTVWAGTEPGAVWRSTDRGATFRLEQAAVGPPAPQGVGRGVRRAGVPHDPAAPQRPGLGHGRHLLGRGLPDRRRRRLVGAAQPGRPGRVPARGPAVPRVRPVRAQDEPAPVPSRAAVHAEPRRRLPVRRPRRVVDLHRRRAARRLRVPGRGAPARAGHGLRLPAQRQRRALPTRGQGPGLALARTPASRGRSSATGCPTTSSSA